MKQGRSLITFVMAALAAALAVYFGVYLFNSLNDPYSTTMVYAYTFNDSVEADGLLVREETVIPGQGGIADVTRGEGEKVGIGQTVALVYQNAQAQADQAELDGLAAEIALLEEAGSGAADSDASLDQEILASVVALRASAALGDFNDLEEQAAGLKSGILRRAYTYGDGLTAADLSARLAELRSRSNSLRQQTASATTRVRASVSGVFSGLVDGYETVLTPEQALQLTPSALRSALGGGGAASGNEIGKLITDDRWYFAASFPAETADRLTKGKTARLRFTGDFSQDVDMRVDYISGEESGEKAVVFSSDRFLARTTLLRRQTAELIFDSWSGLRIPKDALRLDHYTYTPEDSSQEVEDTRLGVFALVGGRLEFKGAEVINEEEDFYVVRPASSGSKALRAGDEIVTRGTGLYDGQLLEY